MVGVGARETSRCANITEAELFFRAGEVGYNSGSDKETSGYC